MQVGDPVPYKISESSRIGGSGSWWVRFDYTSMNIDGGRERPCGGSSSMSGVGSGGSSMSTVSSIDCKTPGEHQLNAKCNVQLRYGPFGSEASEMVYVGDRLLSTKFITVAQRTKFDLVNDPKLAPAIQACMKPMGFRIGAGGQWIQGSLGIVAPPVNLAFAVFARIGGKEFSLGTMTCNKGASSGYEVRGNTLTLRATTWPTTFDLILRSDEQAGRGTVDMTGIWKGELVFPAVPLAKAAP